MAGERAFDFHASFPSHGQPYKPHGDGGGVIVLEVPASEWDIVPLIHKAGREKILRVLVEVTDAA